MTLDVADKLIEWLSGIGNGNCVGNMSNAWHVHDRALL